MNIQNVIDFIYTHTTEDYVLVDVSILEELNDCLKSNTKPTYSFAEIKAIKDDVIHTLELSNEQKNILNDFINELDSTFYSGDKIEEKLSFAQLKAEVVPQSKTNANLNYFYKQRNQLNGQGNRNIKFLESQFDDSDGSMLFTFRTDATYNNDPKKELTNDDLNDGSMINNISDEYIIQLKICDFFDILQDLITEEDNNFTKEDMKAILELSQEVRIGCSCPSSYFMGGDYWLTQIDAQLKPCDIKPKFWNRKDLRGETKVCKHELSMLNHISFFLPQMAMACKKELINYGLI